MHFRSFADDTYIYVSSFRTCGEKCRVRYAVEENWQERREGVAFEWMIEGGTEEQNGDQRFG